MTAPLDRKSIDAEIADFTSRQAGLKQQAQNEEQLRDNELRTAALKLTVKNCIDYSGVAAQLAIALLSVAALTKRRTAFCIAVFVGVIALLATGFALALPYLQQHGVHLRGFI